MNDVAPRLPTGLGTGLGPMPGVDPAEAVAIVSGETDFAFVPELPARGVGADSVGRAGAILIDLPFEMVHDAYRLTSRPGSVTRRARDLLARDLDALEEHWDSSGLIDTGRLLKVQSCGPFTFSAQVELRNGHKLVRDRGARMDVVASMSDGLAEHVRELRRRLGAEVVVQLDEPQVDAVLNGSVQPLTRLDAIPPVPVSLVAQRLEEMAATIGAPMILNGGATPQSDLCPLLSSYSVTVDLSRPLPDEQKDKMAEFLDGGGVMLAAVVPASPPAVPVTADQLAQRLAALIDEIGLDRGVLRDNVVVTPTGGFAGTTPAWAAAGLRLASRTAELLATDPSAL
ncbi:putative methionine synthase, vitamin-B12 independent [Gordonia spumicola]|uniref:Putative methionine synthase, vitamin-B12 independent n=1 Tax=Gordonia spumicola TaxID=589161 RepID=A0A7I9VE86_9ACTN|nr:vitamin-B12 independent methionine synthase [Gordonia spumicola]GEE03624.1 putative methionine synthase, vitamin-B12 independent [Gordonia spumicola]